MINFVRLIILIFVAAILYGCNEHHKIAKKTNFKQAILHVVQQSDAAYVPIKLSPYPGTDSFNNQLINALVARSWLKPVQELPKPNQYDFANGVMRLTFKPTLQGKPYFKDHCTEWGVWKFCTLTVKVGKAKLGTFDQATPMATVKGITTVDFKYSYYVEPYPWFKQLMLINHQKRLNLVPLARHFGAPKRRITSTIKLYFTKQGWGPYNDLIAVHKATE